MSSPLHSIARGLTLSELAPDPQRLALEPYFERMMQDRFSTPLYEPAYAARLLHMHPSRVRRWLFGYSFKTGKGEAVRKRSQSPLIRRGSEGTVRYASFLDLMELLFARDFLERGISLHRMRRALVEAAAFYGVDHPFAHKRFFTAGKQIFLELRDKQGGTPTLLQLLSGGQWAIAPIVRQYAKQIDFGVGTDIAERWWPLGRDEPILVDPRIAFGSPAVVGRGVRTAVVYDLYLGEQRDVRAVAGWMGLDIDAVKAAVRLEQQYRAA